MNNHSVMKHLIHQKFEQCEQFRAWLLESKGKILAEATGSRLWGTGMSPFLSQNTAPDYWPGKNLLDATLTELTQELTDDPMNEGEREDSEEQDHNEDGGEEEEEEEDDDNDKYEDAQQEGIGTQSQDLSQDPSSETQITLPIQNSATSETARVETVSKKTVLSRNELRTKKTMKGKKSKRVSTPVSCKPYNKLSTLITAANNGDIRKALQHVGAGAKRKPSGSPGDKGLDSVHLFKRLS